MAKVTSKRTRLKVVTYITVPSGTKLTATALKRLVRNHVLGGTNITVREMKVSRTNKTHAARAASRATPRFSVRGAATGRLVSR